MRSSARRSDDADVIRARLRALLADSRASGGWVPPDEPDEPDEIADADADADDPAGRDRGWARPGPHREADEEAHGRRGEQIPDPGGRPVTDPADRLPAALGRHRAPGLTARWDPGRPGAWVLWFVGLLTALGVVGWTVADRPVVDPAVDRMPAAAPSGSAAGAPSAVPPAAVPPSAVPPSAGGTAGTVVVSVVGQVASPGLVTLPAGSRVADALAAAGGMLPGTDPAAVNAAALLSDGEQIAVGVPGAAAPPGATGAGHTGLLDLNAATVADLDQLPGIGPVLAQRIIDHRTANGPFRSVDQLQDVSGIGPAIYADLAQRVTV